MKRSWPLLLVVAGLLLVLGSFVYGMLFVGLPNPDAAPEDSARQSRHLDVAFVVLLLGAAALLAGAAGGIARRVCHRFRSPELP
jgi:hypothetical protein